MKSVGVVNLQAQVESVLRDLVRAATLELTKLFESRYETWAGDVGRTEVQTLETLYGFTPGDTKRSIGVQVNEDACTLLTLPASHFLSQTHCIRDCTDGASEGRPTSTELLLTEVLGHADPMWSPLKEHLAADTLDIEFNALDTLSLSGGEGQGEMILHVTPEPKMEPTWCGPELSLPEEQKLVVQPDTSHSRCAEKIKFVCPLTLKLESPDKIRDSSEKLEPQQVPISSSTESSDSSYPSAEAVTPPRKAYQQVHTPMETENHHQMKPKLSSQDPKLLLPCTVSLVDVARMSKTRSQSDAGKAHIVYKKRGLLVPKELRVHQGLHTGHRLCCFTNSGNGIWQLQKVVVHTRDGYACSICGKTFKRRKILRRHQRFHTGEKPYTCSQCPKTFALRKSLRRHIRFHTGERPHTCTQCGKSFRLRDNLKAHLRSHSGEKPFSCTICSKTFRILRNLETHRLSQCEAFIPSFRTLAGL